MKKITNQLKAKARTAKKMGAMALATVVAVPAFASATENKAQGIVNNLLGYIFTIFFWIGILLFTWGVGQMVLAFKNEDADSKSRAMMLIVVAIILTSIGTIVKGVFGTSVVGNGETKLI